MKRYYATCLVTLFLSLTCNNSVAFGQDPSKSMDDIFLQEDLLRPNFTDGIFLQEDLLRQATFIDFVRGKWQSLFPDGNEPDNIPDDYYRRLYAVYTSCSDSPNKPTSLEELTSSSRLLDSRINENAAIEAELIGTGEAAGNAESYVFIKRYGQSLRTFCIHDGVIAPIDWHVGVTAILHIKSAAGRADLSGVPGLAASVELGYANVTYQIETSGVTGSKVRDALPSLSEIGKFDVEGFAEVIRAVDKIKSLLGDPEVTVVPQLMIPEQSLETWGIFTSNR